MGEPCTFASQNTTNTSNASSGLFLQTAAMEHTLQIPEKELLRDILSSLGIQNQVKVLVDPINTAIDFTPDSLSLKIQNLGPNLFSIKAHLNLNELTAQSAALKIEVPKGAFDRAFVISSNPVKISMRPGLGAIQADLQLTANLTTDGTKITLTKFATNLNDGQPRLQVKLGILTVDGKPLELEITSNGQSLKTDEPSIRAEFQNFEPELMKNVQKQLASMIQAEFTQFSEQLGKQDPFKVTIHTTDLLKQHPVKNAALTPLLGDINANFVLSYLQQLPQQNLFSTQVTSQVCLGADCLADTFGTSNITTSDIASMTGSDVGVILYESWAQNIINTTSFQKRIANYYQTSLKSPGVTLGDDGVKIHFNADKNAVVVVVNLKIDIKATVDPATAWDSWSNLKQFYKDQLADLWENVAGSGQYVYVPVEITAKLGAIETDNTGKKVLVVNTEIPFHQDGTITNTYGYKSNVQNMNATIRKELLASVQAEIGKSLPTEIKIPVSDALDTMGIKIDLNQVLITKNKGLLVSGSIHE